MSANFLNTNRNATRFFFATTENGEQDLGLAFGTTGGTPSLSTMSVTLSGGGGSEIVNIAPQFLATEFCLGEQALIAGTASQYFTASTLTSTVTGVNISSDRLGGTGTACIESYAGNGSLRGFEFLSRGLNAELISTIDTTTNLWLSSIGRPGATAVLGGTGTFGTANLTSFSQQTFFDVSGSISTISLYPAYKDNTEFGADSNVVTIAGSSNQATPFVPLFSTPVTGLNPNTQTFLSINWANALSTGSNHVNFKVGFSTATAYTNLLQTSYVPGGSFTPSGQLSASSPVGHTLLSGCCDSDGINADGTAMLYVLGQLSDPNAPADLLFIAKGQVSEATRNALVYRSF
jgi:hypothetical protein